MAGTSGSETKLCHPASSQSNNTQTLSSSLGSRNTVEPLEPCSLRLSATLGEKICRKRSTSSTFVVARIIRSSSGFSAASPDADVESTLRPGGSRRNRPVTRSSRAGPAHRSRDLPHALVRSLLHVEAEHHAALVVLGDVAVGHPEPGVGHVEQDVDRLAGLDEHGVQTRLSSTTPSLLRIRNRPAPWTWN